MLKLSIIIPVYNAEPYLKQCLDSVVNQTLSKEEYEVIVVDDKSTDNSLEIIHEFCNTYKNFRCIELPENTPGGCGIPDNIAINEAKGLYIGFVEADDFIKPEMYERMLNKVFENNMSDLCICKYETYNTKTQKIISAPWYDSTFQYCVKPNTSFDKVKDKLLFIYPTPWSKIYRRQFLGDAIRFPESDNFYEDGPFHWFCITQAKNISIVPEALYYYRTNVPGQTMSRKNKSKQLSVLTVHAKTIKQFLLNNNIYNKFLTQFIRWELSFAECMFGLYRGQPDRDEMYEAIAKALQELFKDIPFKALKNCRRWQNRLIKYWIIIRFGNYALAKHIQDKWKDKHKSKKALA